ncbi:MAG: aldehyde ferredoxin oxidoreductase C-terminal domain-containing protein [Desulfatiglans sp.]|nr:aldehyde ferredoxin oxidoreductase N-terminal domain-containing protein [Thermodesulfobacteriota bacterium]MEE4354009.1 aldehyde ferredoxin oxidoreductase C-terminal domain-containing protein [Desulfatiglans sp.]
MGIPGYAGRILYVDLTSGRIIEEHLNDNLVTDLLGGWGIGQKLAWDIIPPEADPLSPENALILNAGPFGGTHIPGGSKLTFTTKLPLNGCFDTGAAGGRFTHMLKSSGYDHVVITGKSERPVYIRITDDGADLCDAEDLWGMDNFETIDVLTERHDPCSIIPIGQAGENLVKVSVTFLDKGGGLGAGGWPAVMGSKNLKAIVAEQGSKPIEIADRRRLQKAIDQVLNRIMEYHHRPKFVERGAIALTSGWVGLGGGFAWDQNEISDIHKGFRKGIACPTCPMADKERVDYFSGETRISSYMTAFMGLWEGFEAKDSLKGYENHVRYEDAANRYGLDHHNMLFGGGVLPVMLDLYEKGIITKADTGGLELKRDIETVLELLRMIAYREGFGEILAEGTEQALKIMGKDEKYATTIKGYCAFAEPRLKGLGTMEFSAITSPRGGICFQGYFGASAYNPMMPIQGWVKQAHKQGVPNEAIERIFTSDAFNVGRLTRYGEDYSSVYNSLSQCQRLYISRFYDIDILAEMYSALTGIETSRDKLVLFGERAWNLWKALNARAGFDRKDDRIPDNWLQPLEVGGEIHNLKNYYRTQDIKATDIEKLLDDYYDERGWDSKTGIPIRKKLETLRLSWVADGLEASGLI